MTFADVLLATSEAVLEIAWAALSLTVLVTGARVVWWLLTKAWREI